jgi:hypothetical protein
MVLPASSHHLLGRNQVSTRDIEPTSLGKRNPAGRSIFIKQGERNTAQPGRIIDFGCVRNDRTMQT